MIQIDEKMLENWDKSFFCPMDKKMFSPNIQMVYWKMSWFVQNFLQNFYKVPKVYALSRSYLDCLGYFTFLIPNCALGALKQCIK